MTDIEISLQGPTVVRSPNWLGDAVMALPAVRNLKEFLDEETLTIAVPDKLAALWQKCPFVDKVLILDQPKALKATAAQLREGKFANAVLLPNSLRAATESWMAGIPQRIGYARSGRSMLLTHGVPVPPRNPARLHQRFYYLDLVSAIGGGDDPSLPKLRKDPTTVAGSRGLVLAFCPGAEYGPAKRWPVENFIALARHFITTRKAKILLLGAPVDALIAAEFMKQVPEADNRVGKTSLAEFMAALVTARLVICNDSGAMHVASALGVPTMSIYGSTEPALTGPMGGRIRVLRHHVPCSPCFLRECPIDFSCMTGISAEQGIIAAESMLR